MRKLILIVVVLIYVRNGFGQAEYNNPDTGTKVLGSYFGTDVDSVSLTNGNLHVSIPLFNLPGRELPLQAAVTYDSMAFERRQTQTLPEGYWSSWYDYHAWRKNTAAGFKVSASKKAYGCVYGNPASTPQFSQYHGCYASGQQMPIEGWCDSGYDPIFGQTTFNCQDYDLTFSWVKNDGTEHKFTKRVTQKCAQAYLNYDPCLNPPATIYDNWTIDLPGSEFLQLKTGNQFSGQGTQPALITSKGGAVINISGRSVQTPNGNTLKADVGDTQSYTFRGDGLGDYLPLTDTVGRDIGFTRNGDIDTITLHDSSGQSTTYTISWTVVNGPDAYNYLGVDDRRIRVVQNVQLPNGRSYHFDYNTDNGYLEKLTLPSGAYVKYAYYGGSGILKVQSRRVSEDGTQAGERAWSYGYNGTSTDVIDPMGQKKTEYYSGGLSTTTKEYSSSNVLLRQTDRAWSTGTDPAVTVSQTTVGSQFYEMDYAYDGYNNVTTEETYDWGPVGNRGPRIRRVTRTFLTSSTYTDKHIFDRLSSETVADGSNVAGAKTEYFYDDYSQFALTARSGTIPGWTDPASNTRALLTSVRRYRDASYFVTEQLKYDVLGNRIEKVDALQHSTPIDFSDNFCTLVSGTCTNTSSHNSFAFPTRVTNALNQYTTTKYNFDTGLPAVNIDLRGFETRTTYDLMNRATSITEPNGKQTTYSYDDVNRITTKEVTVDAGGNKGHVETTFDGLYRVKQARTNDPEGTIAVDTTYDVLGRAIKVTNPFRLSSAASAWSYTAYDGLGRTICTSVSLQTTSPCDAGGPADAKVQYAYTSNATTTTNEAGNQRRYTYNALGKLTQVEEPNPTLATPLVTTYTYETTGPLKQTNQSGQIRTLTHDWLGRETQEQLPESGTTSYTYDDASHMLTATDARSVVTTYTYDALGRARFRSYSDGTPTVEFRYDEPLDGSNYVGFRTSMLDSIGSINYRYDNVGRLSSEARYMDPQKAGASGNFSTSYTYNLKGDLTQMTYPSGRVVNFNYAANGGCCNSRLASVIDATTGKTLANSMSYDASGALLARTLNVNGTVPLNETFAYNHRMQQTQVRVAEGSTYVMDFSYGYGTTNNVGQLLSRTDAIQPEHSVNYAYDSIYRLSQVASADSTWAVSWTFDAWSNRLSQTPQGYVSSANVLGTQTLGYTNNRLNGQTYDTAGNVTNDGNHTYTFNGKNQITSMDGGTATYMYDGEGRRVKKTVSGVSTFYFYGPGGIISEFSSASGATGASSSDVTNYETSDRHGTSVLLIAPNGLVLEDNRTLPYGELWSPPGTSATTKKFTSYERDQESGLDYAMDRYNAVGYGRFTSPDRGQMHLEVPSTLNRFVYSLNDPINHEDATGKDPCVESSSAFSITVCAVPIPVNPFAWFEQRTLATMGPSASLLLGAPTMSEYESEEEQREAYVRALGLPVGLLGVNGDFSDSFRTKMLDSFVALRQRFLHLTDCTKLLGFDNSQAALSFLRTVSFNFEPNATLPIAAHLAANLDAAFTYDGRVYITQSGATLTGNSLDHLLLHEMEHLIAPDNAQYIDSAEGRKDLGQACQTGQNQ